jgi:hypothetical protein
MISSRRSSQEEWDLDRLRGYRATLESDEASGVHHAGLDALSNHCAQHRLSRVVANPNPVAVVDATLFRIVRMDLQLVLVVHCFLFESDPKNIS